MFPVISTLCLLRCAVFYVLCWSSLTRQYVLPHSSSCAGVTRFSVVLPTPGSRVVSLHWSAPLSRPLLGLWAGSTYCHFLRWGQFNSCSATLAGPSLLPPGGGGWEAQLGKWLLLIILILSKENSYCILILLPLYTYDSFNHWHPISSFKHHRSNFWVQCQE